MASNKNKISIVVRLQHWMDSVPGQTFLNYAYSWGASIVILGTLFKLTHLPGANLMLFIGMGTEVVVFFLSAFDRPFDKSADGKELPEDYESDEEIAAGMEPDEHEEAYQPGTATFAAGMNGQAPIVINGGGGIAAPVPTVPEGMEEAAEKYVETLRTLTETLAKVEEQSRRLTQDSTEMVNMNRTLTGINTVYELQLKSVSAQIGTIDQINEQTRRMAAQIEELNGVYSRMIKALTVNMKNAAAGSGTTE